MTQKTQAPDSSPSSMRSLLDVTEEPVLEITPDAPSRRGFLMGAAVSATTASLFGFGQKASARAARPSAIVQTVRGPVDASKLGFTLPHEHLFSSSAGMWNIWPEFFGGRAQFIDKAVDKLKEARDEGVDTIVDLTTADLGRDIRITEAVAKRSGMQIIACTGHWNYPALSMSSRTVEELTEFFLKEIEQGIEDTDIKAGVIKIATDKEGVTPFIENALRAAARASKMTGAPIETHAYALPPTPMGPLQADIFESEGLSPSKVSIGHSDDSVDLEYLRGLIARGYTVGMDHMSRGVIPEGQTAPPELEPYLWDARTRLIKALIDDGHTENIFISNDWLFADSAFPTGLFAESLEGANPDGILFVTRKVIPYLKELGVSEQQIRTITVDNPRRFFGVG